jgi:two-component system phosphate regulon sensor histidine kinase PhoR
MIRNSIKYIVVLATFSVLGILLIQFLFLKKAIDINEKRFQEEITTALYNVANELIEYNNKVYGHKTEITEMCPVEQVSGNYFVVNVNHVIDPGLLEYHLVNQFKKNHIKLDFEYAIYDCETDKMKNGKLIKAESIFNMFQDNGLDTLDECSQEEIIFNELYNRGKKVTQMKKCNLPKCKKYIYYFGVYFPGRSKFFHSKLKPWYFVTSLLLIVMLFFGYTLYVIIKQRRLSEIQKNFINNLTHEFKTPIASIGLAANVLSEPKIAEQPGRLSEYARIIIEQNKRLTLQVEKVLQMASIERKRLQLKLEAVELNAFIEKTIREFKNSQNGNMCNINFHSEVQDAGIHADTLHFSNLFFNILDNAVKYCEDSPEIMISLKREARLYKISFADNGIGIPKKFRKKIFARFYRIPTGDVHNVKGFGLGLDYVKKIAGRHRWKIEIEDNSPKGTIFIVKIPKK